MFPTQKQKGGELGNTASIQDSRALDAENHRLVTKLQ